MAFVYILRCADNTLYVGHTNDITTREAAHNQGCGGRYTAARRPVTMVYSEKCHSLAAALARERRLKGWTIAKKEALIARDLVTLKRLSKRGR